MSWFNNLRPKIKALVGAKPDIPDNLWHKCDGCGTMIFHRDLQANLHVCQHCGHHMRLPVKQRLDNLFDDGDYNRIELPKVPVDPIKFRDRKRYTDRLKDAQSASGEDDAIMVAHGQMGGMDVVVAAFNFDFMAGSMGTAVGEGIVTAAHLAVVQKAPLIVIPASGGARMQESILSLMQMPRTTIAVQEVKEAGLPYIVLLTHPTTGGVSASFAMLGDIHLSEPGATIGFAGRRVIEQTVRETLPEGFQTSEYLLDHGMVDQVVERKEIRNTLIRLINLITRPGEDGADLDLPKTDMEIPEKEAHDAVETKTVTDAIDPEKEATTITPPIPDAPAPKKD